MSGLDEDSMLHFGFGAVGEYTVSVRTTRGGGKGKINTNHSHVEKHMTQHLVPVVPVAILFLGCKMSKLDRFGVDRKKRNVCAITENFSIE